MRRIVCVCSFNFRNEFSRMPQLCVVVQSSRRWRLETRGGNGRKFKWFPECLTPQMNFQFSAGAREREREILLLWNMRHDQMQLGQAFGICWKMEKTTIRRSSTQTAKLMLAQLFLRWPLWTNDGLLHNVGPTQMSGMKSFALATVWSLVFAFRMKDENLFHKRQIF